MLSLYQTFEEQYERTIHFFGFDIYSKFGFGDGDAMREVCSELGLRRYYHELLIEIVRAKLLPLFPNKIEVYEISTCHNPIRSDYSFGYDDQNANVVLKMTWAEIEQFAKEKGFIWTLQ